MDSLRSQINKLKAEISELEKKTGTAPTGGNGNGNGSPGSPGSEEEESDDDNDVVDEMPAPPMKKGPRSSVSAEAYGKWNQKRDFTPVEVPKSDEAKDRIRSVLGKSFLFQALDAKDLEIIVGSMEEVKTTASGERVIQQGDDGDSLFLIEDGIFECKIKKGGEEEEIVVKVCESGDNFGELALLYNCPRAASVDSKSDSGTLWKLDRETFNAIVKEAACKKRERYETFLRSVSILKDIGTYEISQVADALIFTNHGPEEVIIKQGDNGETFYIVEEGNLYAWKEEGVSLMEYGAGSFFGELALLRNDPRAASVTTRSECKILSIDRKTFTRLLGPLKDLLEAHAQGNY